MKTLFLILAVSCSQVAWGASTCHTEDLQGTYAFLADGAVLVPGAPISGPFMRIGSFIADGTGGVVVTTLAIYNGINFGAEHFSGTYSVTSDCTIDFNLAVPQPVNQNVEFKGQLAAGGNDVTFILVNTANPQAVPPLTTVVGYGKARTVNDCVAGGSGGSWSIELNGFRNLGTGGPGTPFRQVGQIQTDGHGGLLVSFITSDNGAITQSTGAGKYTVSTDCSFDLNYSLGSAAYSVRGSFIDQQDAFVSLNLPGPAIASLGGATLAGSVATGTMIDQAKLSRGQGRR